MANPITWRSIGAPNVGNATQSMAVAQNSFQDAFSSLGKVLNEQNANVQQNWDKGKEANTNAFLARLAEFQTPEEANAAMAGLREQLGGFGAQIDGAAARSAMGSLVETLQRRAVAAQQFEQAGVAHKDWKTDQADRPFLENLQQTNLAADTEQGRANMLAALQAGQAAGVLSSQGAAKATPVVTGQTDLLVKKSRDEAEFGWKGARANMDAAEAARKAAAEPAEAEERRLRNNLLSAQIRKANERDPVDPLAQIGKLSSLANLVQGLEDNEAKPHEAVVSASPFNGAKANTPEGKKAVLDVLKSTGSAWYGSSNENFVDDALTKAIEKGTVSADRQNLLIKDGDKVTAVPLTANLLTSAVVADDGWVNPSPGGVAARLEKMAKDPTLLTAHEQWYGAKTRVQETRDKYAPRKEQIRQAAGVIAGEEKKSR